MQQTSKRVAPALKALLDGFIDYAGLFPPAKLTLETAIENYCKYQECEYHWLLRSFVLKASDLASAPVSLNGNLAVLADKNETRAKSIESNIPLKADKPVYCEVPTNKLEMLDEVKACGSYAKVRTGGLKAEAIPTPQELAAFVKACASRRLPFKATAGLHHPIRAEYFLTYEAASEKATMHGFLNVLMAAAFAWHGQTGFLEQILSETEAAAFAFDERAHWREHSLNVSEIEDARKNFIHSVGSCSFEEPVADLKALGFFS